MAKPDGGPAFPESHPEHPRPSSGMSMRDYFAAAALMGAGYPVGTYLSAACGSAQCAEVAKRAYEVADAMIVQRGA